MDNGPIFTSDYAPGIQSRIRELTTGIRITNSSNNKEKLTLEGLEKCAEILENIPKTHDEEESRDRAVMIIEGYRALTTAYEELTRHSYLKEQDRKQNVLGTI